MCFSEVSDHLDRSMGPHGGSLKHRKLFCGNASSKGSSHLCGSLFEAVSSISAISSVGVGSLAVLVERWVPASDTVPGTEMRRVGRMKRTGGRSSEAMPASGPWRASIPWNPLPGGVLYDEVL